MKIGDNPLGHRAVACNGWRWMPGMLAVYDDGARNRITEADAFGLPPTYRANARWAIPDLSDPATLGCVLALVMERYIVDIEDWSGYGGLDGRTVSICLCDKQTGEHVATAYGSDLGAALVDALESADDVAGR